MTLAADSPANWVRRLIYAAKRSIQRHPQLYRLAYDAATFNRDLWRQHRARYCYASRFGGQWTDRSDFEQILESKRRQGQVDAVAERRLRQWRSDGYLVWEGAIRPELVAAMNRELGKVCTTAAEAAVVGCCFR